MSEMSSPMTSPCYPCDYHYSANPSNDEEPKREKRKYRCRRRSPATIERARMVRRDKANARERRRMNSLNDALEHLRTILPQLPDEPKMTKIETLRVAQGYIRYLSGILSGEPVEDFRSPSQLINRVPYSDDQISPQYPSAYPKPNEYDHFYYESSTSSC